MNPKTLTCAHLKIAAVLAMVLDHSAKILLGNHLVALGIAEVWDYEQRTALIAANALPYYGYFVLRAVGRIAWPLYAFLLVVGFSHTQNRKRYALRLLAVAVISEIPYNLAFYGHFYDFSGQNICFTLLLGYLLLWALDCCPKRWLRPLLIAIALATATLLRVDYGAAGIGVIAAFYLLQNRPAWQQLVGATAACFALSFAFSTFYMLLAFPLLALCNGQKGQQPRWLFYAVYPGHLILLYLILQWVTV